MAEWRQLDDGRLYFRHNVGAVYELHARAFGSAAGELRTIGTVTVESCELDSLGRERYSLLFTYAGGTRENCVQHTLKQFDTILKEGSYTVLEEGKPCELPLLPEEVRIYYDRRASERKKAKKKAEEQLAIVKEGETESEWAALERQRKGLCFKIAKLAAAHEDFPDERGELAELEKKEAELLKELEIDATLFASEKVCPLCENKRIIDGRICSCAEDEREEIKRFNAAERNGKKFDAAGVKVEG